MLELKDAILNDVNTKIQEGKLPESQDDLFKVEDRQFVVYNQQVSVPVRACELKSIIDMDKVFLARRGANTRTDLVTSISNVKDVENTTRIYAEYIIDANTKGVKVLKAYPISMDKVVNPGTDGGDDYVPLNDNDISLPYDEARDIMIGRNKVIIISEELMGILVTLKYLLLVKGTKPGNNSLCGFRKSLLNFTRKKLNNK